MKLELHFAYVDGHKAGIEQEQDRIIKLLDEALIYNEPVIIERESLIALIKGENK